MKPRILFLDDEELFLSGMRRALNKYKTEWEIDFVSSADKAFELLGTRRFCLFVSDQDMPNVTGDEVMRTVQHRWPGTVRVMLSGRPKPSIAQHLMDVAHCTISKPCNPDRLAQYISRVIATRKPFERHAILQDLVGQITTPPLPFQVMVAASTGKPPADLRLSSALYQLTSSHLADEANRDQVSDATLRLALRHLNSVARRGLPAIENPMVTSLWAEAIEIAETARMMAKAAQLTAIKQAEIGVAAAYCNLGSIALAHILPGIYATGVGDAPSPERWTLEKEAFGVDGIQVGEFLLTVWGLSEAMIGEVTGQIAKISTMVAFSKEARVLASSRDRLWKERVEIEYENRTVV